MTTATMTTAIAKTMTALTIQNRQARRMGGMLALLSVSLGTLAGGCARGVATTTIHPNGSWVRSVAYHGAKLPTEGQGASGGGAAMSMPMPGVSVRDAFVLPSGAGWKVTHEDTKDEVVVRAERAVEPGETVTGDITCKGMGQSATIAANKVTVVSTSPGVYQYKETFHWTGPVPKDLTPDAETIAAFKKSLPPGLATDANARDLAAQSTRDLWSVMFGPGDPLIAQVSTIMMEPDLVERRVQMRVGGTLEQHIDAKFGTQMTPAQRHSVAQSIVHNVLFSMSSKTKNAGPAAAMDPKSSNDTMPSASLFIEVRLPGKITATNGERDETSNAVFWQLYPEAAAIGDVTLTATCDTNAAAAQ